MLAQTDLRAAAQALQGVPRATSDDVKWERWAAAVVAYCRPFKRATLRLAPEWSQFNDPDLQRIHGELISLRDKLFAHNDAMPQREVFLVPPNGAMEERRAFPDHKTLAPKRVIREQLRRLDERIATVASELSHGQGWEAGRPIALAQLQQLRLVPAPPPFRAPKSARGEPLDY